MKSSNETATLAGGCFWGMQDILRKLPGVKNSTVGYTGGATENPSYLTVKKGDTGHAESIQLEFDPEEISFEEILGVFFKMHDPTSVNRQGNDLGSQYRSAIFCHSEDQKQIAQRVRRALDESGKWGRPIVTEIVPYQQFYSAEDYHQDYLVKNPGGYTCHYLRD
jgi:methionine-S-sulfoxide reductase